MSRRLLLLVEDNRDDELLTLRAIRKMTSEVDVVVVRDGVAAAERLGLLSDPEADVPLPDLAVIDIKMPKLGGLELLKIIRSDSRTALLPVIVFSSSSEESDVAEAVRLGAVFEQKPVDYSLYLDRVQAIIRVRFLESAAFFGKSDLYKDGADEPMPRNSGATAPSADPKGSPRAGSAR